MEPIDHNAVHDSADLHPHLTSQYGGEFVATAPEDDNPPASAGPIAIPDAYAVPGGPLDDFIGIEVAAIDEDAAEENP